MGVIYSEDYWKDVERIIKFIPNLQQLKNKKILITGSTGLIGSAVVEVLFYLNKYNTWNIDIVLAARNLDRVEKRFKGFRNNIDFKFVYYDAISTSFDYIEPVDFIIHGASPADPVSYTKVPVETMMANILGVKVLLDYLKGNCMGRLLYISSSEVYGKNMKAPYKEDEYGYVDILNSRTCYPSSKRASETLCSAYKAEFGVDFVIVRPGHIYGPSTRKNDSRASAQFMHDALAKRNIIMKSAGLQLRSYCYSLDCASAILAVLLNGNSGEAYNISNPNSIITIRELADLFAKESGEKIIFENPSDVELKGYNLMDNSSLDSYKLESLGWKGCFSALEGVRNTLKYCDYK